MFCQKHNKVITIWDAMDEIYTCTERSLQSLDILFIMHMCTMRRNSLTRYMMSGQRFENGAGDRRPKRQGST